VVCFRHILFSFAICWHLLVAFGRLAALEESIEEDSNLKGKNVREVFDSYLKGKRMFALANLFHVFS